MGFTPNRTTYRLDFSDVEEATLGSGDALEVRARSAEMGTFLDMTALAAIGSDPKPEDAAKVGELMAGFAKVLKSWNITDEDESPVPATLAGLRTLEFPFVMQMVRAWIQATAGVAAPLAPTSSGGAAALVASLPMEPSSESRAS